MSQLSPSILSRFFTPIQRHKKEIPIKLGKLNPTCVMATAVQQNLVDKNAEYASGFQEGDLALPPAKNYAVGECSSAAQMKGIRVEEWKLPVKTVG